MTNTPHDAVERCLARARALIGVPWRHQGRDPCIGLDCVGLLVLALGVKEDALPSYSREPHAGVLEGALAHYLGPARSADAPWRSGDIAVLAYGGALRHCGLLADDASGGGFSLIHTDTRLGRVTEHPLDRRWQRRIRLTYRGVAA